MVHCMFDVEYCKYVVQGELVWVVSEIKLQ